MRSLIPQIPKIVHDYILINQISTSWTTAVTRIETPPNLKLNILTASILVARRNKLIHCSRETTSNKSSNIEPSYSSRRATAADGQFISYQTTPSNRTFHHILSPNLTFHHIRLITNFSYVIRIHSPCTLDPSKNR